MTIPDHKPTSEDRLAWFNAQRIQKIKWLETFSKGSKKRSDWEIEEKQRDLWMLEDLIRIQTLAIEAQNAGSVSV
jgi:hypothetical protein